MDVWSSLGTIASASPSIFGLTVGAMIALAAIFAWSALRAVRRARLVADTPTCKVRSAPQGYVELWGVGRQMDGPPIIAPLSGLPCVWYRYLVEEERRVEVRGRSEMRWVTVEQGRSDDLFWLEDATGRVVVDPDGAEVTPKARDIWYSGAGAALGNQPAFIASYFIRCPGGARHRFTEERLGERQNLYALGLLRSARSEVDVPTVETETVALLRDWKADQPSLKARFDLNGDGTIDQNEWMLARAQARREVLRARRGPETAASEPINIVRRTGDRARPFLLSAYPPSVLASRYRRSALFYSALFLFCGGLATWIISIRLII